MKLNTINPSQGSRKKAKRVGRGIGSGLGRYKSFEGFKNFSNPRAYYKEVSSRFDKLFDGVRPPYKGNIEKILKQLMK